MSNYTPDHRAGDPAPDQEGNFEEEPVIGDAPPKANVLLSNGVYDKVKQVAQIWLPALAVFYITIAPFWGLPKQEEVAGTIMAVDLLLGALLGVLSRQYTNSDARFDGAINVVTDEQAGETLMNVSLDPQAVAQKDEVVVKVNKA